MMTAANGNTDDSRLLQTCDITMEEKKLEPFAMVVFGGAGDLSRRKLLPSLYHLYKENELPAGFAVVGFDRVELNDEVYRTMMREGVRQHDEGPFDEGKWNEFSRRLFGRTCDLLEPNVLLLTIQPDEKITLHFGVKYPYAEDQIYSVNMVFSYRETFKTTFHPAYERLLLECMRGDLTLFVRNDIIEETWVIVDPIISRWENFPAAEFPNYAAGSWGPEKTRQLLKREGRRWITE